MTEITWPDMDGLTFRPFRGSEDFPEMLRLFNASKVVDKHEYSWSVEDYEHAFKYMTNCDLEKDLLFVEIQGELVGHTRVWWTKNHKNVRNYHHFARLHPAWREKGLRSKMMDWNEERLREIAKGHPSDEVGEFYIWSADTELDWIRVVEDAGYKTHTYSFFMKRPDLENVPDLPLPPGIEIRPIQKDQLRLLWDADSEAAKDGFEPMERTEEMYLEWLNEPIFKPELYIVAWDGDRIAGAVQNFIDQKGNEEFDRKLGYTENIHVGREWRGRGLAKAMIARSFKLIKDKGMTEAVLKVEADNPTGALKLYKKMGFEIDKKVMHYMKPL